MKALKMADLPLKEETAAAIGLFDGVHIGHAALIDDLKHHNKKTLIYTFDNKPKEYQNIYTEEEKKLIMEGTGVDYYFSQNFSETFSHMTPEEFVVFLKKEFDVAHITVGFDFRFGKGARGDIHTLNDLTSKYGYTLSIISEVTEGSRKISSTYIRELIQNGEVLHAAKLLSRCYFVDGVVEKGAKLGSTIGFPTANISTNKLLPAFGVYATIVNIGGTFYKGVTNVGVKPTVSKENRPNIETFIMDFDEDAYGKGIRVNFIDMIRREHKFADVEKLKKQIAKDKRRTADMLEDISVYKSFLM